MVTSKQYRVKQVDGKITFQVEELWEGGNVKGPYGSKEAAMAAEERYAEAHGLELILAEAIEQKDDPSKAFKKDENGIWTCTKACSIEVDKKEIAINEGLTFATGTPFMGVDIAAWLEEHINT